MGLFDRIGRRRREPAATSPVTWNVYLDGGEVVAEDGRGRMHRALLTGARAVRVVPLSPGRAGHHAGASGWQVALAHAEGDALLGQPAGDWRDAWVLASLVCEKARLPLDELTERLFSRVGQYTT
jgi:hypothetical protein